MKTEQQIIEMINRFETHANGTQGESSEEIYKSRIIVNILRKVLER